MPADRFQYAINTNSLKGMSYEEIAILAKKIGAQGIEWGLPPLDKAPEASREMRKISDDYGLDIVGYLNAGHLWKSDVIRRWSDAIAPNGGKMLRVSPPWIAWNFDESLHQRASYPEMVKITREGLENLLPLGKEYGITYVVETHASGISASIPLIRYLMDGLDPAYVGIIYDPANGVVEGGIRPRGAVEMLLPYLSYVHAKNILFVPSGDFHPGPVPRVKWYTKSCALECGILDWIEVFFGLKKVGYRGWFSLEEFFKDSSDLESTLKRSLHFLRECAKFAPEKPEEPFTTFND
ncbi:MAG: sugar phosphate isomerase/epimerase [Candidatus Ratteibacteria bacterium]